MLREFAEHCSDAILELRRRFLHLRSSLVSFFSRVPQRIAARDESRRAHAGTVVDLFASIMGQVKGIAVEDMDTAMDILRYDFPNVEHIWLAERFQKAWLARYPLDATLTLAAAKRTESERFSLALEIFTMLHRVGGSLPNPSLFACVTRGLGLPEYSDRHIITLVGTPGAAAEKPIESISFSATPGEGDVTLSHKDAGMRFRALRCVNLLIIVNDSPSLLTLRGRNLRQGDVLPLSSGQAIGLASASLSYNSILFLLLAKYSGVKAVNYLHCVDDTVTISRQRPLNCIARVRFGVAVDIELLRKDADFRLDGEPLYMGHTVTTSYFTPFTIHNLGPYTFDDLNDTGATGHSFQLSPGNLKLIVTNLPAMNRPGVLMLTPGLAPGAVFEVSYSRSDNSGMLRVLEGTSHTLTVGGIPVRGEARLRDGDLIGLSSVQHLRCRFSAGVLDEESSTITRLRVRGLTRDFVRAGRVVDNIDFTLHRGEMACILGPSGSGKSTLLNMLAGHLAPSFGSIHYNDETLTPDAADLRRHIALIPREDILDEAMTVGEHIYHASIARRPRLNHADRKRRVLAVLNFVGLGHLANRSVGRAGERTISDGERTRLNLGLDLTGTAEVFLIDEPISGLASGDAERVIQTLEGMASGRILLCTLHRPAQSILNRFRKVMVLDTHGQMAFWGSPREMVAYFREAARELGLHVPYEAIAAGGADYVFEVLEAPYRRLGERRNLSESMWQERFESHAYRYRSRAREAEEETDVRPIPRSPHRRALELWRLFRLWTLRTFLARVRSRLGLYAMLLEGPVLALLIAGTLRAATDTPYTFYKALHINEYLFLSLVLAMFFGLMDAACEILRDRPLLRRESNYKLFTSGYLLAKTLVLTLIAGVQCALYLLVGNWILGIHEMFWSHFTIMLLTAFVGMSLSLTVSAFARSERIALNIVPLLLVPQILLAGALIRFEEMNEFSPSVPEGMLPARIDRCLSNLRHRVAYQDEVTHDISTRSVPLIAEFCPLRYAFEMIFVAQSSDNLWEITCESINRHREELKAHGSEDELRFIQRAALLLNASVKDAGDAKELLRRVRKAVLRHDEQYLEYTVALIDSWETDEDDQPPEFYYSNRKITAMREGIKTARKDARLDERRGFFLSPRQAVPLFGIDQGTDENSISTLHRNAIYLLLMGLFPIFLAGWKLRRICRGQ